jgi:hypothetical protein
LQHLATPCNSIPNSVATPPSLEGRILRFLNASETPQSPKTIALRINQKSSSVRCALRRLAQKNQVISEDGYYKIPTKDFEKNILTSMGFDSTEKTLPKVHDIHLKFDPKQLPKMLSQHNETNQLFNGVNYDYPDSIPDSSELQKEFIPNGKSIAPLSKPRLDSVFNNISDTSFIKRFFNPFESTSCYQLWTPIKKSSRDISGGFQERFEMRTCRITFQLFGTGTVMIQIKNSETPFNAFEFKQCLDTIDGIFLARTGVHFWDIASLFYMDQLHINNDTGTEYEYSGQSKLNCTVKQFDDFMMRVYEKTIGGQQYLRTELCIDKGNYEDHNLNAMLALIMGNVTPSLNTAQIFKTSKDQQELVSVMKMQVHSIDNLKEMVIAMNKRIDRMEHPAQ